MTNLIWDEVNRNLGFAVFVLITYSGGLIGECVDACPLVN